MTSDAETKRAAACGGVGAGVATLGLTGPSAHGLIAAFFVAVLTVLSVIDIAERRLPNLVVVPSAAIVLAAQIAVSPEHAGEWVLGSVGAFVALLVLALVYPSGLGMGDVKLALLLGAALGAAVVTAVVVAFVAAGLVGVALIATRGTAARKTTLPFGPFLAAGSLVALLLS